MKYTFCVNIENMVNQAVKYMEDEPYGYSFMLQELIKHLKMVRDAHGKGESKEVLDSFFKNYVFNDN